MKHLLENIFADADISKTDLHMHTIYSDGNDSPRDMVISAINKGLKNVGISDHSYTVFDTSYCMKTECLEEYIREVKSLREEFKDSINVYCGIELDYYSDLSVDSYAFDYVIGSVHYIKAGDEYIPVDETPEILLQAADRYFEGNIYALADRYFSTVADVIEKTDASIIGHFDLISKFTELPEFSDILDLEAPEYVQSWKSAIDRLIPFNRPFEINTGAISRGYRTSPYPSASMIEYISSKGGHFILSSDAHSYENIAFNFEKYRL